MKGLTKSTSTPALPRNVSPGRSSFLRRPESGVLNTIPDPRTPSPSRGRLGSTSERPETPRHPDLNDEVATLSTKLINAINHQTNLDDNLQATRHELDAARERIVQLEAAALEHGRSMRLMVEKEKHDRMELALRREVEEERRQRLAADKEKKRMENELENLTTALFEEANMMVVAARKETEASDKKADHYKTQLHDAELLLASHQEQLRDLKLVMAQMTSECDEKETNTTQASTAPSTPAVVPFDKRSINERADLTPEPPGNHDLEPAHPLHFNHLLSPVLRTDTQAFNDFQELLKTAKTHASGPPSRTVSGSYGGLNVMGLGSLANLSTASLVTPSNSSDPSLPNGAPSPKDPGAMLPPLKEIKFYKRAVTEDIEPTLRLDNAPGLSWLARRTVLNSMTAGNLTIEPQPPVARYRGPVFACSLCGENRVSKALNKDGTDPYARKHRFRTSDEKDAQRYPLCDFCLSRVRSCCDYISFLRMCRDGHWRAENGEEEKSAWEESVRLRERMFWARIGGGVVPAFLHVKDSPRSLMVEKRRSAPLDPRRSVESELKLNQEEKTMIGLMNDESVKEEPGAEDEDPFQSERQEKRISIGSTVLTNADTEQKAESGQKQDSAVGLDSDDERTIESQAAEQLESEAIKSFQIQLKADEPEEPKQEVEQQPEPESEPEADAEEELEQVRPLPPTPEEVESLSNAMPGGFE